MCINKMNFEEEMFRFEREINRAPIPAFASLPFNGRPQNPGLNPTFLPSQLHARPHGFVGAPPGVAHVTSLSSAPQGANAVISAPPATNHADSAATGGVGADDDEDVFAKLEKYEADLKKEKKKAKKKAKQEKKLGLPGSQTTTTTTLPAKPTLSTTISTTVSKPVVPSTSGMNPSFTPVSSGTVHTPVSATVGEEVVKKAKKQKRMIRTGGGQIWEDDSLKTWDPNDYRWVIKSRMI